MKKEYTMENALRTSRKVRLLITAFSGFIIFIGTLSIGKNLNNIYYAKLSQSWIPIEALVIESSIISNYQGAGLKDQTKRGWHYLPKIVYKYEIAGKRFTNDRIKFFFMNGLDTKNKSYSSYYTKKYSKGTPINIYVSNSDPSQSVIETTSDSDISYAGIFASLFFLGIGLVIFKFRSFYSNPEKIYAANSNL